MYIQRHQPTHEIADVESVTVDQRSEKSNSSIARLVAPELLAGARIQGRGSILLAGLDDPVSRGDLQKLVQT